jgi:hypothetical protein
VGLQGSPRTEYCIRIQFRRLDKIDIDITITNCILRTNSYRFETFDQSIDSGIGRPILRFWTRHWWQRWSLSLSLVYEPLDGSPRWSWSCKGRSSSATSTSTGLEPSPTRTSSPRAGQTSTSANGTRWAGRPCTSASPTDLERPRQYTAIFRIIQDMIFLRKNEEQQTVLYE